MKRVDKVIAVLDRRRPPAVVLWGGRACDIQFGSVADRRREQRRARTARAVAVFRRHIELGSLTALEFERQMRRTAELARADLYTFAEFAEQVRRLSP